MPILIYRYPMYICEVSNLSFKRVSTGSARAHRSCETVKQLCRQKDLTSSCCIFDIQTTHTCTQFTIRYERPVRHPWTDLWNQLPVSFRQPCTKHPADDVTLSNSPPTCSPLTLHHTFTVSFQAKNSPFPQIFSTIVC